MFLKAWATMKHIVTVCMIHETLYQRMKTSSLQQHRAVVLTVLQWTAHCAILTLVTYVCHFDCQMRVLLKLLQGVETCSVLDIQALASKAQLCMLVLNSQLRIPSAPVLCVKL